MVICSLQALSVDVGAVCSILVKYVVVVGTVSATSTSGEKLFL